MNASMTRGISVGAIVLACVGFIVAAVGGITASICYTAPEPHSRSLPLWIVSGASVLPRTATFHQAVGALHLKMDEFKKQVAGQPYIVSYSQRWHESTVKVDDRHPWLVVYFGKKPGTEVLIASTEDIPWSNNVGWFTETTFDSTSRVFVEASTGKSYWLFGLMAIVCLIGLGLMTLAYSIRHD